MKKPEERICLGLGIAKTKLNSWWNYLEYISIFMDKTDVGRPTSLKK